MKIHRNIFAKRFFAPPQPAHPHDFWILMQDVVPPFLSPDLSQAVSSCLSQSPSFLFFHLLLLNPMRFFFDVLFEMLSAFPWFPLTFSVNLCYSQELRSNHMNLALKMILTHNTANYYFFFKQRNCVILSKITLIQGMYIVREQYFQMSLKHFLCFKNIQLHRLPCLVAQSVEKQKMILVVAFRKYSLCESVSICFQRFYFTFKIGICTSRC